jgi:hypothetical protein
MTTSLTSTQTLCWTVATDKTTRTRKGEIKKDKMREMKAVPITPTTGKTYLCHLPQELIPYTQHSSKIPSLLDYM